jgi:general secretion pathway protein J
MLINLRQRGFTLIEICVALLIFSIISISIGVGFQQVMRNKTMTDKHEDALSALQMALFMMDRDVAQAINRSGFAVLSKNAVFIGTPTSFQFVRGGYFNPLSMERRSNLQVVRYALEGAKLVRYTQMYVDVENGQQNSSSRILFEPLDATTVIPVFLYLDYDNQFQPAWPPLDKPAIGLPKAVQVAFSLPKQGNITQLYLVANGNGVDK